jgi:ubiquinone/menaquinone biosynthesis C-methylase UbiE
MPVPNGYFDERAKTWDDDPAKVQRAKEVAETVRAAVPLRPDTRLLEYGAGTGLVAQELQGAVGAVTLADSSEGMLDVMRAKLADGTFPDARVWDLDLSKDPAPQERFDVIVTVLTLHHIVDVSPVLAGLASLLERDGSLCVVDLEEEDGSFHGEDFVGHHGFARDELASQLESAGLTDVRFQAAGHVVKPHGRYPMFLATCRLPPTGE